MQPHHRGLGPPTEDTVVVGDRRKQDVLRADRADGFQLRNMTFEQGAYNNVDLVETNGFYLDRLTVRYGSHYGILTFTADNGVYDHIEGYGHGDSAVYPGSGPERHCQDYGIQVRHVNAYGNVLAASGTAGNGTWTHDNHFHDNAAGLANDSFAPGHPGMPQDCSKWTGNRIHSNNVNYFTPEQQQTCIATPFEERAQDDGLPRFQVVVGVGFMFYGVNDNLIADNYIYDQHRNGIRQFAVPAAARGEMDPAKLYDTSQRQPLHRQPLRRAAGRHPRRQRRRRLLGRAGRAQLLGGQPHRRRRALTSDPADAAHLRRRRLDEPGRQRDQARPGPALHQLEPEHQPEPAGLHVVRHAAGSRRRRQRRRARRRSPPGAAVRRAHGRPSRHRASPRRRRRLGRRPAADRPARAPDDRILAGPLRNTSSQPLRLDGAGAVLRDDAGRQVERHRLLRPGLQPRPVLARPTRRTRRCPTSCRTRLGMTAVARARRERAVHGLLAPRGRPRSPVSADLGAATVALPPTR